METYMGFRNEALPAGSCGGRRVTWSHVSSLCPRPLSLHRGCRLGRGLTWATLGESIPSASGPGSVLPSWEPSGELGEGTSGLGTGWRQDR